jgi:hypothetical protein
MHFYSIALSLSLTEGGSVTGYVGRTLEGPASSWDLLRAGLDDNPDGLALISREGFA